jgi:hypothetical protein
MLIWCCCAINYSNRFVSERCISGDFSLAISFSYIQVGADNKLSSFQ